VKNIKLLGVLIEEKPWSEFLKRLAIKNTTPEVSPKMLGGYGYGYKLCLKYTMMDKSRKAGK
jgi:hypothetical protein